MTNDGRGSTSDPDDTSSMSNAVSAGKWLRKAFLQPHCGGSTAEILRFMNSLDHSIAASAIQLGNTSNKVPLHYACQFRPELVTELISRGAVVSVATLRGHTPLIFAAGRGHNDVVRSLLQHGANPRVITVTGDTATSMGKARLDEQTQSLLVEAETLSGVPWQDYRTLESAQQAQRAHVKTCPHCRRKGENERAAVEKARLQAVQSCLVPSLEAAIAANVLDAPRFFVEKVAPVAACSRDRSVVLPSVRMAIKNSLLCGHVGLCDILSICAEAQLKKAFQAHGCHDLRPVRSILLALMEELEESKAIWIGRTTVAEIIAFADAAIALELLLIHPKFDLQSESAVIKQFCIDTIAKRDVELYSHSAFSIPERSLGKKAGGPVILAMQKCLQLISLVGDSATSWCDLATVIVVEAIQMDKFNLLRSRMRLAPEEVACAVNLFERVASSLDIHESTTQKKQAQPAVATCEVGKDSAYPAYELQLPYQWVADASDLRETQSVIEEKIAALPFGEKVWMALDTEWGDDEKASHRGPSIVQVALIDRVWIVDTCILSTNVQTFFRWLFSQRCILFLGFSFREDVSRLSVLLGEGQNNAQLDVLDLQKLNSSVGDNKGNLPGLHSFAIHFLNRCLDKREQCSDWDRRPLTKSQLRYAAADAAVLLDIANVMGIQT